MFIKDNGPKKVKLFINQTRTLDFDTAERSEPIQEFEYVPGFIYASRKEIESLFSTKITLFKAKTRRFRK